MVLVDVHIQCTCIPLILKARHLYMTLPFALDFLARLEVPEQALGGIP